MKGKKESPRKLNQTKLTAFWTQNQPSLSQSSHSTFQVNAKKRKFDENICKNPPSPNKKISLQIQAGSEKVAVGNVFKGKNDETGDERCSISFDDEFEDFGFEDLENNSFLSSPKKEKSPKKNILAEKHSQDSCLPSSEEDESWLFEASELDFDIARRCVVVQSAMLTKGKFEQVIQVVDKDTGKRGLCRLRDVWACSSFSPDDVVTIKTVKSDEGWIVDNKSGYVVLNPDVLISSTSLINSMFCLRRGLLTNIYKGVEPGTNRIMLIGRLVHEFLQKCLRSPPRSEERFEEIISELLKSHDYLYDFYMAGISYSDAESEMRSFIPSIKNFLDVYVHKKTKPTGKNFTGSIENVLDIEELIKAPNLGFQGRIDVTVKVKSRKMAKEVPLELKTGRASFSNEHRSQLILYVLLMNELGRNVDSGLLFYLKEGIIEEIVPKQDEIRNLFLLRNRLVGFYKSLAANDLPEPIRLVQACGKCPYLRICTSYLKREQNANLYDTHPIRSIDIPDVESSHIDYFMAWSKMLWLEHGDLIANSMDDHVVHGLRLKQNIQKVDDGFRHTFEIVDGLRRIFQPGTFVHVFDCKNTRIASAKVAEVNNFFCSLVMETKLNDFSNSYAISAFQNKFIRMYLGNLGCLLNEEFKSLREIIIDMRPATFNGKLDKKSFKEKCLQKLLTLNKDQQRAVLKCLVVDSHALIKGPPGTGKTHTIAALVRVLVALGRTVLIAGHTHSSVDNILLRLDDIEYLRLGSLRSVNKEIHGKCFANLVGNCCTVDEMGKLFERKVVASTCLGLDCDLLHRKKFDFCVVDESSQVLQPEIIRPLLCCEKFILVGDEDQLPPIVQNPDARKLGMNKSLFERLGNDPATIKLHFQYRMNRKINELANTLTYKGLLECANEEIATATMTIPNRRLYLESSEWIRVAWSPHLENSVIFIDTSGYFQWKSLDVPVNPRSSVLEANIIRELVSRLISFGVRENSVGVIAAFVDQVELLRQKLGEVNVRGVELNTVDQFQGRDKDIIVFSCGKENRSESAASEFELLNDKKRFTVIVTRAKYKLAFVGDRKTMAKYQPFKELFANLNDSEYLNLANGQKDFFWKDFEGK